MDERRNTLKIAFVKMVYSKVDRKFWKCKEETAKYIIDLVMKCLEDDMFVRCGNRMSREEYLRRMTQDTLSHGKWSETYQCTRKAMVDVKLDPLNGKVVVTSDPPLQGEQNQNPTVTSGIQACALRAEKVEIKVDSQDASL